MSHTEETKRRMRESALLRGIIPPSRLNKKVSLEGRNRMSLAKKNMSLETKKMMSESKMGEKNSFWGKHHTNKSKVRIGIANSGSNSPNWKGGITKERVKLCNTKQYRDWRDYIFKRDK